MATIDRHIADSIAKDCGLSIATLGLRFDKVVVRLVENLRIYFGQNISHGKAVVVTVSAPIRLPKKTEIELRGYIADSLECGSVPSETKVTIHLNAIHLRIIEIPTSQTVKFVGLIHNPTSDTTVLLDLVAKWLKEGEYTLGSN